MELQRQLGHKRYEPIWAMLHKLRAAMGKRDKKYGLKEYIELDKGFFESVSSKEKDDGAQKKRGRGSIKQDPIPKPQKKRLSKYRQPFSFIYFPILYKRIFIFLDH